MSIRVMSSIFDTEFRDLEMPDKDKNVRASTLKLVCLALADCANDEGESIYPGLHKLGIKTGLSKQGLIDTIATLKYHGVITVDVEASKLGTNEYTVNLASFPHKEGSGTPILVVNTADQSAQLTTGGTPRLPVVVSPVDTNHTVSVIESSAIPEKTSKTSRAIPSEDLPADWKIAAGLPITEEDLARERGVSLATEEFERALLVKIPWGKESKFQKWAADVYSTDPEAFKRYAKWQKDDPFKAMSVKQIRHTPQELMDTWPAFEAMHKSKRKSEYRAL
jgi:hypothetical protein